jgi:hypothetical protein
MAHQRAATLTRVDNFFDPTNMRSQLNETFTTSTRIGARLVVSDRMNSPPWTFGPYVIPTLALPNDSEGVDTASFIHVGLPVRRGYLTCELVPQDQMEFQYIPDNSSDPVVQVRFLMSEQDNCLPMSISSEIPLEHDGPFGRWDPSWSVDDGCPTSSGWYGTLVGGKIEELNVVMCWSFIQELQALAQFSMPGWKMRSLQVDESTIRNISSGIDTQLDLRNYLLAGSKVFNPGSLDPVFSTFLQNSTHTEDASLLHYNNFEDLYARIQGIYGRAVVRL